MPFYSIESASDRSDRHRASIAKPGSMLLGVKICCHWRAMALCRGFAASPEDPRRLVRDNSSRLWR